MAAQTQTALIVPDVGKPLVLDTSFPAPQPGSKQVQVKIAVAGVNPHDQKARDMGLFIDGHFPAVIGNDVTGTVHALGPDVTKYKVGDRVFLQSAYTWGNKQNALQQYCIADEDHMAKIPDGLSDDEVVTLPTNLWAPLVALFAKMGMGIPAKFLGDDREFDHAGTTVLIVGGGASTGKFATQLAKLAGIGRIVVVGGDEKTLKEFGATHVIDRHGSEEEVLKRIQDVVGDDLLYCLDGINIPAGQFLGLKALSSKKKGTFARLLPFPWDPSSVQKEFVVKDIMCYSHLSPEVTVPFWQKIPEYLQSGQIKPMTGYVVEKGMDADKVNDLLDRYRDGKPAKQTHFHF